MTVRGLPAVRNTIIVGICTEDFSRVFDLVRLLNERGMEFVLLSPGEVVDRRIDVAIVEGRAPRFAAGPPEVMRPLRDPGVTLDRAVARALGVFRPRNMVLGIDPGLRTGIAVLSDGRTIDTSIAVDLRTIPGRLRSALTALRPRGWMVRIGNGDPARRDAIIRSLFDRFGEELVLEMVDERSTSIEPTRTHEDAAGRIARMGGRRLFLRDYQGRRL
jgi:hypothetical protein